MKVEISKELNEDIELIDNLKKHNIEISDLSPYKIVSNNFDNYKTIKGEISDGIVLIDYKEVEYFEAIKNDIFAFKNKRSYKTRYKLYQVEDIYEDKGFIRVSKSFVVNIRKIQRIKTYINTKYILVMENGNNIDVNRSYYKKFKERIGL